MLKSIDLKYTIIYVYIHVYIYICTYVYIYEQDYSNTSKGKGTRLFKTVLKVKNWEESVYPILRLPI